MSSTDVIHGSDGGAVGALYSGHVDVRAILRHYLPAFKAAEPWREIHIPRVINAEGEILEIHPWRKPEAPEKAITAALQIRDAIYLPDVWDAEDELNELMAPPPEENIRAMLIAMLSVLKSKPTEGAPIYIDALVFELTEPETGQPICGPAIAAAVRETWNTQTFAPSVHEFMVRARKQQQRIEMVRAQLRWLSVTQDSALAVLEKLAPGKLPKPSETSEDPEVPF
jgi:hypothetical protein